jgi:hypothetical protein
LQPQDETARPVIYPKLPSIPSFVEYGSRQEVRATLAGLRGIVVLYGASGVGKSTLAAMLAREADEGSGWFLNASAQSTLTAALATAELAERGGSTDSLESADLTANANAARLRLKQSPGPWVVVLDNADLEPVQLPGLPEVDVSRGQLLLVTTTEASWRSRADHFVVLEPLGDDEVRATLAPESTTRHPARWLAGRY